MSFADAYNAYLQKHAIGGQLISEAPDPKLHTIIAIPAYNESGLTTCLDSLFHCDPPLAPTEVIILINSAKSSSREIVAANRQSYAEVQEWIRQHRSPRYRAERSRATSEQLENSPDSDPQDTANHDQSTSQQRENDQGSVQHENANRDPNTSPQEGKIQGSDRQDTANRGKDPSKPQEKLRFHVVLVEDLPDKHFGAGLARKLVMDEAVRRLAGRAAKEKVAGIIVSLDADTVVRRDYLRAVEDHFSRHPKASGCSISFEHPLSRQEYEKRTQQNPPPENFPPEAFEAVVNYELHQRYYLQAVRYTGYPYAYHTVGSCFAVQVEAYCRAGGMSRRQAGEDFYFIQKLAMQGGFTECRTTRVYPSPRPSDRVPFGTGPDISRQIGDGQLDASAKHSKDRDSYGTGPDSGQTVRSGPDASAEQTDGTGPDKRQNVRSGPDASAEHTDVRHTDGTGPDSGQTVRRGPDASTEQTDERHTDGTGPDSGQLPPYLTYNPELFEHLREFFALIPRFYRSDKAAAAANGDPPAGTEKAAVLKGVPPLLGRYLEESGFWEELEEIRGNTASEEAFRKRFFNKFNMFRILKYLHFAEEHGVEKIEVTAAAGMMLEIWENAHGRRMPDGMGLELESPDRRKNEEEGSVDGTTDGMGPDSGVDSPIRKKDSPKGSPTREMLLLYRKYFG